MRKLGVVILALGILLLGAAISSAKTIYVNPAHAPDATHATTITGGMLLTVSTTLSAPDTIYVVPGTYTEAVTVNKNVIIVSTGGRLVTKVVSSAVGSATFFVGFGVTNVAINGFTITGALDSFGVIIGGLGASNVRVKNCIIEKCGIGIGVFGGGLSASSDVTIANNTIRYSSSYYGGTNEGVGILVQSSSAAVPNVIISSNQIVDNDLWGIYVYGAAGSPSFSGMRIGSNTLVNNWAIDLFALLNNHNWNWGAISFDNAAGSIALNNNKFQAPAIFTPFFVTGASTPTFSGTGNATYNNCNKNVGGTATPLATP